MTDDTGAIVGIRLRSLKTGQKWAIKRSRAGLFVPTKLPTSIEQLFITEGPTDCAALLSIGFSSIGRPSCNGAVQMTDALVRRLGPRECVLVADDDANGSGRRGAEALASRLITVCPRVRIVYPPTGINDARDWIRSGATGPDVMHAVRSSDVLSLSIKSEAI